MREGAFLSPVPVAPPPPERRRDAATVAAEPANGRRGVGPARQTPSSRLRGRRREGDDMCVELVIELLRI
jgi:hypothetical protein